MAHELYSCVFVLRVKKFRAVNQNGFGAILEIIQEKRFFAIIFIGINANTIIHDTHADVNAGDIKYRKNGENMLPNRTYYGIRDIALETEAIEEHAREQAAHRTRTHRHRHERVFYQLFPDRRALMGAYKRLRDHYVAGGELSPAAEAFCDNFYVIEKSVIALQNNVNNIKYMRLPVCAEGELMYFPRVYAIAVAMVGHRDGRIDEALIEKYLDAYQAVTPLTMREITALPYMIKMALTKLLRLEGEDCVSVIRHHERAGSACEAMLRIADDPGRLDALFEKLEMEKHPAFVDKLIAILAERDDYALIESVHAWLEVMDADADTLIIRNRQNQAKAGVITQNAISSLRLIDSIDAQALFDRLSRVEYELSRDKTYKLMDQKSRAYYRSCVERMANRLNVAETVVARKATELAGDGEGEEAQLGYYLFNKGMKALWHAIRPDKRYIRYTHEKKLWGFLTAEIALMIPLLILAATGGAVAVLLILFPAWTIANFVVIRIAVRMTPNKKIPRYSMEGGIGEEHSTLTVVPTLITSEKSLISAIENIETHYLSNPLDHCYFAVLGDFKDSRELIAQGEEALLHQAKERIGALNAKYAKEGEALFYFLHRKREYLISDGIYLGRERKRGALMALTDYLMTGNEEPFLLITSPLPKGIKYCLTLDADTVLPRETLSELIGAMAHPMNKPVLDEDGVVRSGYGIIVPRMRTLARSAAQSPFARLFSGEYGLDIYATAASEFYQDTFSEGIFGGKGIFDVEIFHRSLSRWIRENAVLSHDLLEGCFVRAGFMGDVALYDSEPGNFAAWWKRRHRWIRGDWQLLPYIFHKIRDANGEWQKNPLSVLSRWKMLENIRRTLLSSGILYTIVVMPYIGMGWYVAIALAAFFEGAVIEIFEFISALITSRRERMNAGGLFVERINTLLRAGLEILALPYETFQTGDAMSKALVRMFITHKKMLEWQPAADSGSPPQTIFDYYRKFYICPVFGTVMAIGAILGNTPVSSIIFAIIWLLAPLIIREADMPKEEEELSDPMRAFLMSVARDTWRFFDEMCNEKTAFLPPDNFQKVPLKPPVFNTSPTNIGMALMAALSAMDMRFIGAEDFLRRMGRMLDSIERMEKWHGHLYNWYALPELTVLPQRYVSTVDSGNLVASLLTLEQALLDMGGEEADSLAQRAGKLARETDFRCLYDSARSLFHIGYDANSNELSKSWYDLLASEARLTTFVAVALNQIKTKSYFTLSRLLVPVEGGRALISWSGTMFEYLMPILFTGLVPGTLLAESCEAAVKTQQRYSDPWGISESGYFAFDKQLYYQYRAFGTPKLSLMATHEKEFVISPYSSMLSLMIDQNAAAQNLWRLSKLGMLSSYGMYEAMDLSPSRMTKNKYEIVASFMSHHQGMSLCAINNVLFDNNISARFMRVPEIRATSLLLEEKRPSMAITIREFESGVYQLERKGKHGEYKPRVVPFGVSGETETQLLTNGTYTVMLCEDGTGYSRCGDVMLTRYRKDNMRSQSGMQFCIRHGEKTWSMSSVPMGDPPDEGETVLEPHGVKFSRRDGAISSRLEVCVSPEYNAEVRKLTISNHGGEACELEAGILFEVCLATQRDDLAHPAFVKLRTDAEMAEDTLLFYRRKKNESDQSGAFMYCTVISEAKPRYCTDRLVMPGRNKNGIEALQKAFLPSMSVDAPIEPGFYARMNLVLEKEETATISLVVGFASSKRQALSDAEDMRREAENAFSSAWLRAASALRFEGVERGKADVFERVASRILLGHAQKPHQALQTRGGIRELWRLGISGDLPIVLIVISRITQSRMVKTLFELSNYLALRGEEFDLVIVGDYKNEYRNEVRRRIEELIGTHARLSKNVHLLHGYGLSDEDKALLRGVAAIEIDPSRSLDKQFARRKDAFVRGEQKEYPMRMEKRTAFAPKALKLMFDNGYGGFDLERDEYVIRLNHADPLPLPWCNVMANESFGSIVTESGGGYTWHYNSREHKLTKWISDPVCDMKSEFILITDDENGATWTITEGMRDAGAQCTVAHGYGYTRYASSAQELEQELLVFVDSEAPVKYSVLTLNNPMMRKRTLSLMYCVQWCLGVVGHPESIQMEFEGGLFARSFRNDESLGYAYIAAPGSDVEHSGNKIHILNGGWDNKELDAKTGMGLGDVGAIRTSVTLQPGACVKIIFMMGEDDKKSAQELIQKSGEGFVEERFGKVREEWNKRLFNIRIKSSDVATDIMLNGRLLYQLYASRILARSGYYQCGGAVGFRDQLQDMLALRQNEPERVREHILLCAARQFRAGDVLHWWHEPYTGVRTDCSDDKLFLPYAVLEYIESGGDYTVLQEKVPFLRDVPMEGARCVYRAMQVSDDVGSVYEHCVAAIESAMVFGQHGLPLMGGHDWNDGMDDVGENGGESVWLGWFLLHILERFSGLAQSLGDKERAARYREKARKLRFEIEDHGWDGAWYKRAFFGDGAPLGSHENDECSIDCICQSWAVFCDAIHAKEALDSAMHMLVDEENGVVKLLAPPFVHSARPVGYIEEYLPGVRENGGQYTHAAAWMIMAACKLHRSDIAAKLFSMLNPITHSDDGAKAKRYKTEPYAVSGDVYSVGRNAGRGGWSWYTGAAGWLYTAGIEYIFGIQKHGDELIIAPHTKEERFEFTYRYGGAAYQVFVARDENGSPEGRIKLVDDGLWHRVDLALRYD